MNYKFLLNSLLRGLPPSMSHTGILISQMTVMHMATHKQFNAEAYKEEANGFIEYAKEKLLNDDNKDMLPPDASSDDILDLIKIAVSSHVNAVDAVNN